MNRRFSFLWKVQAVAFIIATIFAFFTPLDFAFAQQSDLDAVATAAEIDTSTDIYTIVGNIINVFFTLLGIIFLVLVIYAGYLWMTAAGRPERIEKAKKMLINGVIGLVITLLAFAITTFIINALGLATGVSNGGTNGGTSTEPLSGSLGSGVIRDHYPARSATDVARNTKVFVTFKDQMNIESFIDGYSISGTATDVSDDIVATALNTENVKIYVTANGSDGALLSTDVTVAFTDDLKTFVFDPPVIGSPTEDVNYTVFLSDQIQNADGQTPVNLGGYQWTFTTGTELDVTPPEVISVIPVAGNTYDRNIAVQVNFSEAMDPTASTGLTESGFQNIQVRGDGAVVAGAYDVSNAYKTVTFTTTDACGTNSCGETIYCLPGDAAVDATIFGATVGANPPQADSFPYDGVVDVVGNSLDADGDWGTEEGEVGDDYLWAFTTTNDINLSAPEIDAISPDINASNIDLDQDVIMTFGCENSLNVDLCDSVLMSSTISSETILLTSDPEHELWHSFTKEDLSADGEPVSGDILPLMTEVTIKHGIFLASTDEQTYQYGVDITEGIRNQYQNCFVPAQGPNAVGGRCGTTTSQPFCCGGTPSASACPSF